MNFDIKNFNLNQLYKENEYINNTYFNDLLKIEDTAQKEKFWIKRDVFFNGVPYTLYESQNLGFKVVLIPKHFQNLGKDFIDIIVYSGNNFGLHFSKLKRKNSQVELISYDFVTNEFGYSTGNYHYNCFADCDKKLEKTFLEQKKDITIFLINENYSQLFNYEFNRLKRSTNETKINKIYGDSLFEAYQTFDKHFEVIDDNESPLMEILENLEKKKSKKYS